MHRRLLRPAAIVAHTEEQKAKTAKEEEEEEKKSVLHPKLPGCIASAAPSF